MADIARRLAERAESVCSLLIPGGKIAKSEYVCSGINGGEGDSLKVHLSGTYAGHWKDWANPDAHHGDLLDLWRLSRDLSPGEAIQQAKAFLGILDPVSTYKPKTYKPAPKIESTPPNPSGRAFGWLTAKRGLTEATIALYRLEVKQGTEPAIIFPCYSPTGALINRSYRTLGESKKVWQDAECAPSLFGWQGLPKAALDTRTVLLSEGQIDCMTWHQWGVPALSIPNGSGQTWIDYEWENLSAFDKIYIAFDMDAAGEEMIRKATPRLGAHRCYIVRMPHKDANDCLMAGSTAQDAQGWLKDAKAPNVTGLVLAADMEGRLIAEITPKPKPFTLAFFDKDWTFQHGLYFRPAEVTLWTGISHAGKSTFLNYLTLGILGNGLCVFIASMEVRVETTLRRLATCTLATLGMQRDEGGFRSWLWEYGHRLVLSDVVGFITQDKLFEMMRFSFRRFGVQHFVIDSMMRVSGLEEDFPAQGDFMNKLQEFSKESGAHIHLVVHPRKMTAGGKPGLLDVKGSSLVPNNADNVVVVSRNPEKAEIAKERDLTDDEKKMHDTEITVEKQRETGWQGTFYLRFNPYDFTYKPCERTSKPKPEKQRRQFGQKQPWY